MDDARQIGPNNTRVVVIGAGIAGLSAAEHLLRNGFRNVTVLEAMDRIGGRMHTTQFGSRGSDIVEVGANWIHGACASNSVFTLANQLGMLPDNLIFLDRMEGYCYKSYGKTIDKNLTDKLFAIFQQWEDEEPNFEHPSKRPSMHDYMHQRLQESLLQFSPEERDDVKCIFNCLMNYCRFHNAGFLKEFPMPEIDGYVDIPGGNVKVPSGMTNLLGGLTKDFPKGTIKLNQEVISVNWDRYDVQIICRDGSKHLADHVICTMSLGYLKEYAQTIFNPPLSQKKLQAIESVPYGKVDKIFLYWEKPFWKRGIGSIKFGWTNQEAEVSSSREWYKKIFAFDEVLNNPNVLVGWISGNEAEHMETLPESEVIHVCAELIRKFLKDPSIPTPTKVLCTRWCTNPFSLGSYSYRNYTVSPGHIKALSEPVKQGQSPRILFAGEATSPGAYSTMHGARESGLREAEMVTTYYGLQPKSQL